VEKKKIWDLVRAVYARNPERLTLEALIEQAVLLSLKTLRANATQASTFAVINRVTGRILNSFEESRMQTRIFAGVQNSGTVNRYATQWCDLILFLLKLAESDESCLVLSIRYLRRLPTIGDRIKRIQELGTALLAANPKQLDLEECLREFAADEDEESDTPELPINHLALHARKLVDEVDHLSFDLVRHTWHESAFASPVIG